jgi:hypothetical protein
MRYNFINADGELDRGKVRESLSKIIDVADITSRSAIIEELVNLTDALIDQAVEAAEQLVYDSKH